jgi:hypothetical protein
MGELLRVTIDDGVSLNRFAAPPRLAEMFEKRVERVFRVRK